MKTSNELKEARGVLDKEFNTLKAKVAAKTPFTDAEELRFDEIINEISTLNSELLKAETREKAIAESEERAKGPGIQIHSKGNQNTDNEEQLQKRFYLTGLIDDLASGRDLEGLNKEVADEGVKEARAAGLESKVKGTLIPAFVSGNTAKGHNEYQARLDERRYLEKRAAHTTSTADTPKAGYLVHTDVLVNQFIDVFRNNMVLDSLGVTMLMDLVGNISIPKKTTSSGGGWLSETGAITLDNTVLGQVTATPHRIGNGMSYTKTLMRQVGNFSVENMLKKDMAEALARIVQLGLLSGSGSSNQPTGIATAAVAGSINLVAGGTNGLAPTWANMVALETAVADDNADSGSLSYLFNAVTRGKLKTVEKTSTSTAQFIWENGNVVNGQRATVTNSLRSNLTKGSASAICSEAIFGNWADAGLAQWGGIDLVVDPYTSAGSNTTNVYYNMFVDVFIRRQNSFSYIADLLTT